MSMNIVNGICVLCLVVLVIAVVGAWLSRKPMAILIVVLAAAVAVLTGMERGNLRFEDGAGEVVVKEEWRIAEGSLGSDDGRYVGINGATVGNIFIPIKTSWNMSHYVITTVGESGEVMTRLLPVRTTMVYADAPTWDDARVYEVLPIVKRCSGTFFGVPVDDTLVSGKLSLTSKYEIHIPAEEA